MLTSLSLTLCVIVTLGQAKEVSPTPALDQILRGLEEIDQVLRGYSVEVEVRNQHSVPPIEKQSFINQTAKVVYKSDKAGHVFCEATLNTVEAGKPLVMKERSVFNGEVVRRAEGASRLDSGRITKNVAEVFFQGINPRHFLTHYQFEPAGKYLAKYDGKVVGTDSVGGRKVVVVQLKTTRRTDGIEFTGRFFFDPERSYTIVKVGNYYRIPPTTEWTEFARTEVQQAVQDPSGIWLPTRVLDEGYRVSSRPGLPPQLLRRSEIVLKNWVVNPVLPDSVFAFDFQIGLQSAAHSQDQDKSNAEKPKKPALYDPKVDARTQIDAATAKAKRQNARVLVMFGFEG